MQVLPITEELVDSRTVMDVILKSSITDKQLIVRVLEMEADEKKRIKELLNMAATYREVHEFMLGHIVEQLSSRYTENELDTFRNLKR